MIHIESAKANVEIAAVRWAGEARPKFLKSVTIMLYHFI